MYVRGGSWETSVHGGVPSSLQISQRGWRNTTCSLTSARLISFSSKPVFYVHQINSQLESVSTRAYKICLKLGYRDWFSWSMWSCQFALYNIKKIRLYLSEHAPQLLVQALIKSCIACYTSLLAVFPVCMFKPLQLIKFITACLVFTQQRITSLLVSLHWLVNSVFADLTLTSTSLHLMNWKKCYWMFLCTHCMALCIAWWHLHPVRPELNSNFLHCSLLNSC